MMSKSEEEKLPRFTIGIGRRYDSLYLRNGDIKIEGFDIEYPSVPTQESSGGPGQSSSSGGQGYVAPASMFTAMATNPIYDVGEQAFSTYLQAVDYGKEITAIPIFPSRFFPHSQIAVNIRSGIQGPADLVGKRIGIGSFAKNYAVWLRGVLKYQYGVDVEKIIWVEGQPEHFSEYHPPDRYSVEKVSDRDALWSLLESGGIDAVSMPRGPQLRKSPIIQPLFADPYKEIRDYLKNAPFFPINTVMTLPKATLSKNPALPKAVFSAFQEALSLYRDEVMKGSRDDEHSGLNLMRIQKESGLSLPDYGFRANLENIRMMIRYCYEQGVIGKDYDPEELFLLTET